MKNRCCNHKRNCLNEPTFQDAKDGLKGLFSPFVDLYDSAVKGEKELTEYIASKKSKK